jgi:hypothetical protein
MSIGKLAVPAVVAGWAVVSFSGSAQAQWVPVGGAGVTNGQVEGMSAQGNPVIGAGATIVAHPTDPNILYLGSTNGGIWKTTNGTAASPTWVPTTDFQQSLSTGALAFDPTDLTGNTLVAGVGVYSSFGAGGSRTGLLRTTNGGATWTPLTNNVATRNISGVVARGNTIVTSVNFATNFSFGQIGIYRSTDAGASFSLVSGNSPTNAPAGLPGGRAYDLVADPRVIAQNVLYTAVRDAGTLNGIYRSTDTGASWARVSSAAMQALNNDSGINSTSNIEMAVGNAGQVYVGFMGSNGQLTGLFRSPDGSAASPTWAQLDSPSTNENGISVGLQPNPNKEFDIAGGQGQIHFSIAADPLNANIVYVGGDRQPRTNGDTGGFPNSIGAQNFTGRLFRVDASLAAGSQAIPLTHNPTTNNNSAPHADSREIVFDAAGNLIESDDGGIYRRSNAAGIGGLKGDWTSINGTLRTTEIHGLDYDRIGHAVTAGTQDVGTIESVTFNGTTAYRTVNQGDGGKVAIDDRAGLTNSVRYTSAQQLQGVSRRVVDANNNVVSSTSPALTVVGQGVTIRTFDTTVQFYGPIAVNKINGNLLIGTQRLYESADGGSTVTGFNSNAVLGTITGIAAGGRLNGVDNPDVLYAAASNTNKVYFRSTPGSAVTDLTAFAATPGASGPVDLALDFNNWQRLFVADPDSVFLTTNAGTAFTSITGNLGQSTIHTIEFASPPGTGLDVVLVGTDAGVFFSTSANFANWQELAGDTLPNAPVYDLVYDSFDNVLVAGTLGRGAWTLANFGTLIPEPATATAAAAAGLLLAGRRPARRRAAARAA